MLVSILVAVIALVTPPTHSLPSLNSPANTSASSREYLKDISGNGIWVTSFRLEITAGVGSPDCYEKRMLLINGGFPAPTIRVQKGDLLRITLVNKLVVESTSIHLHGFHQRSTPFYDGASMVTQFPVAPQSQMTYEVPVDERAGTYYYHAHNMYQNQFIYGALLVEDPVERKLYNYDEDRILLMSDWWHTEAQKLVEGITSLNFTWITEGQSLLTNGKTVAYCNPDKEVKCKRDSCSFESLTVDPGKTYRFRIIGATSLHYLHFHIPGHTLYVIEADGEKLQPFKTDYIEVNSGQRYSFLVTADQTPKDYWMRTETKWRGGTVTFNNGYSLLRYTNVTAAALANSPVVSTTPIESVGTWVSQLKPLLGTYLPPPTKVDDVIILKGMQKVVQGYLKWVVNDVSMRLPSAPHLQSMYGNASIRDVPQTAPIKLTLGKTYDIILQNYATAKGICEQHSWHLHGYSFWDMGGKDGVWSSSEKLNNIDPIRRDTSTVFGYKFAHWNIAKTGVSAEPFAACGWRALRIVADNPGMWLFHCHVTAHMILGMGVVFQVGESSDLPPLPSTFTGFKNPPRFKFSAGGQV